MASASQEELRAEFNKIDSDGNGSLSLEELSLFVKSVSSEITDKDVNKIFKYMDIDGDGKITFDEFYEWWQNKENKILPLLYIKQNIQKNLAKAQKVVAKATKDPLTEAETMSKFKASLKIGDSPSKSVLEAKLSTHIQSLLLSQKVRSALSLDENQPTVILKFKVTKDQEEAKKVLTDLVEQSKELLECMLPPEISSQILGNIDIKVESFETDGLLLSISSNHPLIQAIKAQYTSLVDQVNAGDKSFIVDFTFSNSIDFKEFVETPNADLYQQFLKGIKVDLAVEASKTLLQNLRQIIYDKVIGKFEEGESLSSKRRSERAMLLIGSLLNGISVSVEAKDLTELLESPQVPHKLVEEMISIGRSRANPEAIISSVPIFQDFIDFFLNYLESEIGLLVIAPGVFAEIKLKTQNLSVFYKKFLSLE